MSKKTNSTRSKNSTAPNIMDIMQLMSEAYKGEGDASIIPNFNDTFKKYLDHIVSKSKVSKIYNVVILYSANIPLSSFVVDLINYNITNFNNTKPLLMVLLSPGGDAGSAFILGKLCREFSNKQFVIVVPREAKSAATLLCCAANEIHMGSLSELGPIDPQINGLPALGLENSIKHIAKLAHKYPGSSSMFAEYLSLTISPVDIGYYKRVTQSNMQYAEYLLNTHTDNLPSRLPSDIAYDLVHKYKDHGFVIDIDEATEIFEERIIKSNTEEFEFGNSIYSFFRYINEQALIWNLNFAFIGGLDSNPIFSKLND